MKKFKKIALASALALSMSVVPLTATQQASAATDWQEFCKNDDLCTGNAVFGMRVNSEGIRGATRLEIKSGAGVVSITPYNTIKANKPGEAIVYFYDKSGAENGKYYLYRIIVK
ncbi:hypothetical protein ACOMCU_11955 [Lysinibacillus sp. UGB7]|uniref:hypothetical protein n=1 Tax=Lysinibacillus sp. UGB7 TaxID=3411039 RepID=UPI003B785B35